ncbi:3-mercaptopyruvate sulfurtransferase [Maritalea sp. S77]|uniref:3-mercaptopyruvate sulfurtransferase n=1 Tax=Maritalea sp. S77 TaxID=3415125 RepID=UPI003C7DC553
MSDNLEQYIIEADELAEKLGQENLVIFDASMHLPNANRDAAKEFEEWHIPGALFYSIKELSDPNSSLSHTMPSAHFFEAQMQKLGVNNDDEIIVYDTQGLFSAARAWWMLTQMGAQNVRILNGGFPFWDQKGLPTEGGKSAPKEAGNFSAKFDVHKVAPFDELLELVNKGDQSCNILDARGPGRFKGETDEPREGMRAGHMPGAENLHYARFLDDDGRLLPKAELARIVNEKFDSTKPTIATCGSGVTACVILLVLEILGHKNTRLYDGSWSEWGARPETPIVKG